MGKQETATPSDRPARRPRRATPPPLDEATGIARVAVDVALPHLDRFFDYGVPARMEADAVVGARVQVQFAGRPRPGFIVERPTTTDAPGRLAPLTKVVSPEPVLTPAQTRLIRAVADHYAGTFADVMRLAVPPRHAATEQAVASLWRSPDPGDPPPGGLCDAPHGRTWLDAVTAGRPARALWQVDPVWRADGAGVDDWTRGVTQAVMAALRGGRGGLVVVPDARDLGRARAALEAALGPGTIATLHHELGPTARYRNYLGLSRGDCTVAVGTRSAVFAPVRDLGLVVVVDDGDDLLAEPRAPYLHARDVAALRAVEESVALLLVSTARSCEAERWVDRGWMVALGSPPAQVRRRGPLVRTAADTDLALERDPLARAARLPHDALSTIRAGLASGPVLVQVPRAGYVVGLACARCHRSARCGRCRGPLQVRSVTGSRSLICGWCGQPVAAWRCPDCGARDLRAPRVGSTRTAEELGRAFPGYRLIDSAQGHITDRVGPQPALVVCTPGAEPFPEAGYAAAVLLDTAVTLQREDLRAGEEALRRWLRAVALVRDAASDGTVCVVGEPDARAIQALVRLDPGGFAARELADRAAARFPPAVRVITADGEPKPLRDFLELVMLPSGAEALGPVATPAVRPGEPSNVCRAMLRAPLEQGAELTRAVKAAMAVRASRKSPGTVRIQVDPVVLA